MSDPPGATTLGRKINAGPDADRRSEQAPYEPPPEPVAPDTWRVPFHMLRHLLDI